MSLNKIIIFSLLLLLPMQSMAIFGLAGRAEQKQKIAAAREAYSKGNYGEAIRISQDFLAQNQDAPKRRTRRIYVVLGDTYKALGDYDHALLTYQAALELLPKDPGLNLVLADLYYKTELYDKAINFYQKTLEYNKNNPAALLGLARAYLKIGFLSQSRQYFKEYLGKNANTDNSVLYEYALVNHLSNKQNVALHYALRMKKEEPENPDVYFLIAKIYNSLNATESAVENIEKAIELSNSREDILLTALLWKSYNEKYAYTALKEIKAYQKENPQSQLAVMIEAISFLTLGKKDKYFETLKKIKNKNDNSFINQTVQEILKDN